MSQPITSIVSNTAIAHFCHKFGSYLQRVSVQHRAMIALALLDYLVHGHAHYTITEALNNADLDRTLPAELLEGVRVVAAASEPDELVYLAHAVTGLLLEGARRGEFDRGIRKSIYHVKP